MSQSESATPSSSSSQSNTPGGNFLVTVMEYAKSILIALVCALVIRSFIIEPFKIPSSSMVPTLLIGDHIFVSKFYYGLRLPLTKMWPVHFQKPARGDVIVFIYPIDESRDYIKRVVGVAGDKIRAIGHDLFVNDEMLEHDPVTDTSLPDLAAYDYYRERIGDKSHLVRYDKNRVDPEQTFTVPDGQVFVMGDNRDNSQDSRVWGGVPLDHLKGKALFIWLSRNCTPVQEGVEPDLECHGVRWNRFGDWIE